MSDGHAQALVLGQKAVATRMLEDMPDGLCYPASVRAVALAGPPLTLLHCVGADLTPAFLRNDMAGVQLIQQLSLALSCTHVLSCAGLCSTVAAVAVLSTAATWHCQRPKLSTTVLSHAVLCVC
jgi:hypothetical protein